MKILIVGTGGVGGYFGGRLAQSDHEVTFIARGDHKEALEKEGLRVQSINGNFTIKPVNVTNNILEVETPDLVIIAVKAWQVKDIARHLQPIISNHTMILPLQNGVLAFDELKEVLPEKNILPGLCRIISKIEGPGRINHLAVDPIIIFGEYNNIKSSRVLELEKVFNDAGFKGRVANDIQVDLWKKFIAICVSALLAVTRSTYGEVREQKETRQMMRSLFEEISLLANKMNVNIETDFVDKTISFIDTFPYESTSSLTRDVWEGKPSELEYQNGTVVKLAEKVEVDVPVNRFIYYSLLLIEKRARQK